MTVNPATPDDLVGYTGSASAEVLQWRLDQVWRALQREPDLPDLVARMESGELSMQDVTDAIVAATLRVLRNPEGYSQESGSIDDWRESYTRADATEDIYFTAAEIRRLRPRGETAVPTAGSFKYC